METHNNWERTQKQTKFCRKNAKYQKNNKMEQM